MASFLILCQRVAARSGTVSGTQPLAVTSQTGRLAKIVEWVEDAYVEIQGQRDEWLWMRGEYETALTIGLAAYEISALVADRPGALIAGNTEHSALSLYDADIGVSDEGRISVLGWAEFRAKALIGGARETTGKPVMAAVDNAGSLHVWPTPDKAYVIHGVYRKAAQRLEASIDVPDMPVDFHDLIMWQALLYLGEYDESLAQLPLWNRNYMKLLSNLERRQLPAIQLAGTFA